MRILVASGSSGGHLFPALAFLEAFRPQHPGAEIRLVVPRKRAANIVLPPGYDVSYIRSGALVFKPGLGMVRAAADLIAGWFQSLSIVVRFRPDVAVGFGSIASIPVLVWAKLLGKRVAIHEQNVIPGRANRLLAHFADIIAVSFEKTREYWPGRQERMIVTGNPVRADIRPVNKDEAVRSFGLDPARFTVLVMGGSQGSLSVNQGCMKLFASLSGKGQLQVIHLSGNKAQRELEEFYRSQSIPANVTTFCDRMSYAYSASDLALCRSGATTLQELIMFGLPALLVPYPHAYRHQWANAALVAHHAASVIVEDEEIGSPKTANILDQLIQDRRRLARMRENYRMLKVHDGRNAALLLAEAVL